MVGIATTDPPRLTALASWSPSCASGFAFACMSTIRHLRWQVCLSSPEQIVGFAEKNTAYGLQDRIVFVDQWVNCLFGSFPHPLDGGGGWVPIFRVCSDLDQNRAVFWSKSEHETPETPETPETLEKPETLSVNVRIAFLSTFQRTLWQS